MATAKQRAWRAKFARLYGRKRSRAKRTVKATRTRKRATRGAYMVRRKGFRRSRSGGMRGLLMPLAVGLALGTFGNSLPVVGSIEPMATGAAGGFLMKRNIVGLAAGAAGGYIGSRYVRGMIGSSSTTSAW